MTAELYKARRELSGTQSEVAAMLGVTRQVVSRRESGAMITQEAWLALNALPKKRKAKRV
jgi:DNA-binding XRE family transcriptional regulator